MGKLSEVSEVRGSDKFFNFNQFPHLRNLKIKIMEDFINRTYTKKELGQMYFPESMPRTAVNHLMSWIRRCRPLWDELQQMGYDKTCKSFTPKQVKAIIEYLGEPG